MTWSCMPKFGVLHILASAVKAGELHHCSKLIWSMTNQQHMELQSSGWSCKGREITCQCVTEHGVIKVTALTSPASISAGQTSIYKDMPSWGCKWHSSWLSDHCSGHRECGYSCRCQRPTFPLIDLYPHISYHAPVILLICNSAAQACGHANGSSCSDCYIQMVQCLL